MLFPVMQIILPTKKKINFCGHFGEVSIPNSTFYCFQSEIVISSDEEDPGAEGGDEHEDDRESDSEFDEDDLWACPQCNLKNHPMSRQCARCWAERHAWLPTLKRFVYIQKRNLSNVKFSVCGQV